MPPKPAQPKIRYIAWRRSTVALPLAVAALSSGCEREIIAPEHVKCMVFATGETFTASKANMRVMRDIFFITDDTGKVHIWQLIPEDSNAYQFWCIPHAPAGKDPDNAA